MSTVPFPTPTRERPPVISRRAMLTASAAVGLTGLASGYVTFTRPLLRPAAPADHRPRAAGARLPSPENTLAQRHLATDAGWAADAKYVIRNGRSVLFFNDFERLKDQTVRGGEEKVNTVRLTPFAMVFSAKENAADERPVTIVGETAYVKFAGEIEDIATADPGRIVGGRLPGMVTLRGPDGLELLGSDFYFSEETGTDPDGIPAPKLWSDKDVAFRQGEHSGRGRGLEIDLFRIGPIDTFDSVAVSGAKTVTIRKDVEMDLRIGGSGGGPFESVAGTKKGAAATKDDLPTRVTCSGAFTFNLLLNQAEFEGDVVASRAVAEGGAPDSLDCSRLTILFEPTTEQAKAEHAARLSKVNAGTLTQEDGFQATGGQLAVTMLIANSPPGQATTLRSPSNEFTATLGELRYDAKTGVTSLIREGGDVVIHQATSQLVSPKVILEPVEGGGPPRVSCLGKGWMKHEEKPGQVALRADWTESLHRLRGPDGLDLIRLIGAADVRQPREDFRLIADRIDLWLDPKEGAGKKKTPSAGQAFATAGRMEPVRLVAERVPQKDAFGNDVPGKLVRLRSPELMADAEKLDVTFVDPPAAKVSAARRSRAGLVTASQRIRPASAEQPAPPAAPPPGAASKPAGRAPASPAQPGPSPGKKPADPIQVVTQTIAVVVERQRPGAKPAGPPGKPSDRGGQVREVHTTGGVRVAQARGDGKPPLLIQGDRLDLTNRGEGQELVQIYGTKIAGPNGRLDDSPAWVRDQDSHLWGMNINLDRRTNVAWVDGKGVLDLPVKGGGGGLLGGAGSAEAAREPKAGKDEEPKETRRLQVWWSESMKFDGEKANFMGGVQTQLAGDRMACEEMEVRFTRRFDFAAAGRPREGVPETRPEVAEVLCKDKVVVSGEEYRGERHVGKRQAEFGEFRYDRRTGATHAVGPGKILIWRRSGENSAGLAPNNAVRANATSNRETTDWEYIKITFTGDSDGNLENRTTTFERDVQVVYGPVLEPGQAIDPNHPDRVPVESGWMTCGRLTLTQHEKTATEKAYSELVAEQNVRLDGRDFSGEAEQVTYDESKGQYILRSFGKREATLAKRGSDQRGDGEFFGQTITFYPATRKAVASKSTGGSGSVFR